MFSAILDGFATFLSHATALSTNSASLEDFVHMHQQRKDDLRGIDDIEAWLSGPPNLPTISFEITLAEEAGDGTLEGGLDVLAGAGEAEGTGGENHGFIAGRPGATDGLEHGLLESLSWVFSDGAAIGVDHAALGEDDAAAGSGPKAVGDRFGDGG